MVEKEDLLIFKMRQKSQEAPPPQPEPQAQPQPVPEQQVQAEQPAPATEEAQQPVQVAQPPPMPAQKPQKRQKKGKSDIEAESRQAASGLYCEWHPWRQAYAVCYTCHKPYCYEDISEYNGRYYCLEDIDAAAASEKPTTTFEYNKVSMVSASAFILTILVYVYFVSNLLVYIGTLAAQSGIGSILSAANSTYMLVLAGLLILIFVFMSGVLIFAQSRKGYWLAIFSGSIAFVFFSYIYISNFELYGFVISALSFIGIVGLRYAIHSKTMESQPKAPTPSESLAYNWPTASSF